MKPPDGGNGSEVSHDRPLGLVRCIGLGRVPVRQPAVGDGLGKRGESLFGVQHGRVLGNLLNKHAPRPDRTTRSALVLGACCMSRASFTKARTTAMRAASAEDLP